MSGLSSLFEIVCDPLRWLLGLLTGARSNPYSSRYTAHTTPQLEHPVTGELLDPDQAVRQPKSLKARRKQKSFALLIACNSPFCFAL
jgi:hypothetical protein